jgi:hypothetical protein
VGGVACDDVARRQEARLLVACVRPSPDARQRFAAFNDNNHISSMAASSASAGWAQLRQQARSLETQVSYDLDAILVHVVMMQMGAPG